MFDEGNPSKVGHSAIYKPDRRALAAPYNMHMEGTPRTYRGERHLVLVWPRRLALTQESWLTNLSPILGIFNINVAASLSVSVRLTLV